MKHKKIAETLKNKLENAFSPEVLSIVDESAKHAGHLEAGEETHFRIKIVSKKFSGMSQVQRHRLIYDVLAEEMKTAVHALALTVKDAE